MTSLTPMSHAKIVASSSALAFASKGLKGRGKCLLKVVMTDPKWSRMTLYHGNVGGTQRLFVAFLN